MEYRNTITQPIFDNEDSNRGIPSFIEALPPLILNPFMRPRPQKGTNLLHLLDEESDYHDPELVQVYLRIKPCTLVKNLYEIRSNKELVTSLDTTTVGHGRRTQHNVSKLYSFSHIFVPETSQKEIFEHVVKDHLKRLPEGYNFTLLTYGASGSGKTYTLMGTVGSPGLVPRSLEYIFHLVEAAQLPLYKPGDNGPERLGLRDQECELQWVKKLRTISAPLKDKYRRMSSSLHSGFASSNIDLTNRIKYYLWVSFVEIYNEAVYDLLDNSDRRTLTKLRIREDQNGNAYVKGAIQAFVRSGQEAYDVMVAGKHNLQVAATGVHAQSSRSHCIFTITMLTETDEGLRTSYVRLCDLAGCERARNTRNTGARMQESRAINSSLHVLERCLHMLRKKQRQRLDANLVPYRESKLTRLLGSGLSGIRGEAVSMVVTINPAPEYAHETKHVLQLATVARDIQLNHTTVDSDSLENTAQDCTMESLAEENMRLRADNERLHYEMNRLEIRNKELLAVMDENQCKMGNTMQELVEEAKDMTKKYYENIIKTMDTKIQEIKEEYECLLHEERQKVQVPRDTYNIDVKFLENMVTQLKKELVICKEQLEAERLAYARLKEEEKHLRTCIEERDAEVDGSAPEAVIEIESESESDDESYEESLEPTFVMDNLNKSRVLRQSLVGNISHTREKLDRKCDTVNETSLEKDEDGGGDIKYDKDTEKFFNEHTNMCKNVQHATYNYIETNANEIADSPLSNNISDSKSESTCTEIFDDLFAVSEIEGRRNYIKRKTDSSTTRSPEQSTKKSSNLTQCQNTNSRSHNASREVNDSEEQKMNKISESQYLINKSKLNILETNSKEMYFKEADETVFKNYKEKKSKDFSDLIEINKLKSRNYFYDETNIKIKSHDNVSVITMSKLNSETLDGAEASISSEDISTELVIDTVRKRVDVASAACYQISTSQSKSSNKISNDSNHIYSQKVDFNELQNDNEEKNLCANQNSNYKNIDIDINFMPTINLPTHCEYKNRNSHDVTKQENNANKHKINYRGQPHFFLDKSKHDILTRNSKTLGEPEKESQNDKEQKSNNFKSVMMESNKAKSRSYFSNDLNLTSKSSENESIFTISKLNTETLDEAKAQIISKDTSIEPIIDAVQTRVDLKFNASTNLKLKLSTNADSDISLAQFEQLEMASKTCKEQKKNEIFGNLEGQKKFFDNDVVKVISGEFPCSKIPKEPKSYFDKLSIESENANVKTVRTISESSLQTDDVRSPSIVKDDISTSYVPCTIKNLIGDSLKRNCNLFAHNKKNMTVNKKQESVDMFESPLPTLLNEAEHQSTEPKLTIKELKDGDNVKNTEQSANKTDVQYYSLEDGMKNEVSLKKEVPQNNTTTDLTSEKVSSDTEYEETDVDSPILPGKRKSYMHKRNERKYRTGDKVKIESDRDHLKNTAMPAELDRFIEIKDKDSYQNKFNTTIKGGNTGSKKLENDVENARILTKSNLRVSLEPEIQSVIPDLGNNTTEDFEMIFKNLSVTRVTEFGNLLSDATTGEMDEVFENVDIEKVKNTHKIRHSIQDKAGVLLRNSIQDKPDVQLLGNNTLEDFETVLKSTSGPRNTEFENIFSNLNDESENGNSSVSGVTPELEMQAEIKHKIKINTMLQEEEHESEKHKYNLRHRTHTDFHTATKPEAHKHTEDHFANEEEFNSKSTIKTRSTRKNLRLRRRRNDNEETDNKLKDIANLQKEFSDVTLDLPALKKEAKDIQSPEKNWEESENLPPYDDMQSCSKSISRSRRKLFTPRAEPLDDSPGHTGDSTERIRVPRPSYHRSTRVRRKL